jgi:AraC family transcriptional regulator
MKVMVLVKATKSSEAGAMPDQRLLTEMGQYNEELVMAGLLLSGEGLHPSSTGARVEFSGTSRTVTKGPFVETKDLVVGFWMWQVNSLAEAIEWVKRCPNTMDEDSVIEIRRVFEAADFGESFTPELKEQEASVRAQASGLGTIRFEDGPAILIVGSNENYTAGTRAKIPDQWMRFARHIGHVTGQVGMTAYGVCWNCKPAGAFDYLAGVEVKDLRSLPEGFTHVQLSAQRYAIFTHSDHVSSMPATIDAIWTKWAPDAGLTILDVPCFEKYTEDFDPLAGMDGMEIWIPIKA